jgi:hypothetical protein
MLAGFISFFLLMYAVGLGYRSELRYVNVVIQLFFLYQSIRAYYVIHPELRGRYMSGVMQGMRTSLIGIAGFALFMTVFLTLNPTLLETIREHSDMGEYLGPITASLFILVEGVVISLIGSYILTRILLDVTFKRG